MYPIKRFRDGMIEVFANDAGEVVIKTTYPEHDHGAHYVELSPEDASDVALALTVLANELAFNAAN